MNAHQAKGITIPQWLVSVLIPAFITIAGWVWTASALAAKVSAQEEATRVLFVKVNGASDLAKKHDAILPLMQTDISEIKTDVKSLLKAVKV